MGSVKTICVANQKGGVGKTTTAISLAAALGLAGKRTLLVDIDPQANATSGAGVSSVDGDVGSMWDPQTIRTKLHQTDYPNLWVLPGSGDYVGFEKAVSGRSRSQFLVGPALQSVSDLFEFVVIDSPPSLGSLTRNALAAADSVMIPIQCEYFAMEGLARIVKAIKLSSDRAKIKPRTVLFTMFDPSVAHSREVAAEVRGYFKGSVFDLAIPRDPAFSEAASFGKPIYYYDETAPGAYGYLELAREVLQ